MNIFNDIEDFTTDQLREEIEKREKFSMKRRCWYCKQCIDNHTCKYKDDSPAPGWKLEESRHIASRQIDGSPEKYWQVFATHLVLTTYTFGLGDTESEARSECLEKIKDIEERWNFS